MQFALLIHESPEAFAARKSDGTDPYTSAWRAYYKALVESGVYVAGDPSTQATTSLGCFQRVEVEAHSAKPLRISQKVFGSLGPGHARVDWLLHPRSLALS